MTTIHKIANSPSKTLASILAMFCLGIAVGNFVSPSAWQALLMATLGCVVIAALSKQPSQRVVWFTLAALLFGMFRITQVHVPSNTPTVADVPSSTIAVSGVVNAEVERRRDAQRVVINQVHYAAAGRSGRVLVWAPLYPEIHYGDELVFSCKLDQPEPFNGFAYDKYLEVRDIGAVCYFPQYMDIRSAEQVTIVGGILALKRSLVNTIQKILPEPHASYTAGLLFGGSTALSDELKTNFSRTGTSHILAASGFNVSLFSLVFLSWILSTSIGRKRGLILTAVLLVVYVISAGMTPAVMRAGVMGGLVLVEKWISRKAYMLNVFLLTGAVMLLFNPLLLLYDVGFQLSFVATAAVVLATSSVAEYLTFLPDTLGIREAFAGSVAAITLTAPIILWHFGELSLIAPIVNLLILPLIPYTMAATGIALVAGLFSSTFGAIIALPAWALSQITLWVIQVTGYVDFAVVQVGHARLIAVALIVLMFILWKRQRYATSKTN